jgi:hypothetical protein
MITIMYTDGTVDEFKSDKYLTIDTENSREEFLDIIENSHEDDDDDYDSDNDTTIAEIKISEVRKIQYD